MSTENKKTNKSTEKTTEIVKCKQCGADMFFDINIGALKCPYCYSAEGIKSNVFEGAHNLDRFDETKLKREEGTITYQCPNCHAKTVMHDFGTSAKCPFCGATNIITIDELPGIAPDAILPFKITKENAVENSQKWIKKKFFAPRKLKKTFTAENMNGLYAPAFIFDSDTSSTYEGRLGKQYTVVVGTGKNQHTETRIRWFRVSGSYTKFIDDVLIEASSTLEQNQIDKVGAFDTQNAVEYTKEYIAGLASECHDIGVNQAFDLAKSKMSEIIRKDILSKYDYDRVDYLNVGTEYNNNTFKQLLVPMWCCSFTYKDKLYRYLVNGRSGRVGGKSPVSPFRVAVVVIMVIAIIAGFYYYFMR